MGYHGERALIHALAAPERSGFSGSCDARRMRMASCSSDPPRKAGRAWSTCGRESRVRASMTEDDRGRGVSVRDLRIAVA